MNKPPFHNQRQPIRKKIVRNGPFIGKLNELLTDEHSQDICCFSENGDSFIIHDRDAFVAIFPKYFKHKNLRSFCRQLNLYGFRKCFGNGDMQYSHPLFIKDRYDLHNSIKRGSSQEAPRQIPTLQPQQKVGTCPNISTSPSSSSKVEAPCRKPHFHPGVPTPSKPTPKDPPSAKTYADYCFSEKPAIPGTVPNVPFMSSLPPPSPNVQKGSLQPILSPISRPCSDPYKLLEHHGKNQMAEKNEIEEENIEDENIDEDDIDEDLRETLSDYLSFQPLFSNIVQQQEEENKKQPSNLNVNVVKEFETSNDLLPNDNHLKKRKKNPKNSQLNEGLNSKHPFHFAQPIVSEDKVLDFSNSSFHSFSQTNDNKTNSLKNSHKNSHILEHGNENMNHLMMSKMSSIVAKHACAEKYELLFNKLNLIPSSSSSSSCSLSCFDFVEHSNTPNKSFQLSEENEIGPHMLNVHLNISSNKLLNKKEKQKKTILMKHRENLRLNFLKLKKEIKLYNKLQQPELSSSSSSSLISQQLNSLLSSLDGSVKVLEDPEKN